MENGEPHGGWGPGRLGPQTEGQLRGMVLCLPWSSVLLPSRSKIYRAKTAHGVGNPATEQTHVLDDARRIDVNIRVAPQKATSFGI
jgi:hypothetical protein